MNNIEYAENEIILAVDLLKKFPNEEIQRDRLVYWLAYLGDFDEADKYATSQKHLDTIAQFKNGR